MGDGSGKHLPLAGSAAEADRASLDGRSSSSSSGRSSGRVWEREEPLFDPGGGHMPLRDLEHGRGAAAEPEEVPRAASGASMLASFFNLTNAIVGAGLIGLPYAARQAGVVVGAVMIVVLALLVDWTLRVLALGAKLSGQQTYQGLVQHCFGGAGLVASSLFQGAMAGGGMASFIVIVGDTLPHVLAALLPAVAASKVGAVVLSRRFVVAVFVVCLAYPLSLHRDVGKLGKTSAFAVVAMCTIITAVVVEGPRIDPALRATPGTPVSVANTGVFQAVGIITFAFVCHHNSFMIHGSLRKPTLNRYFEVIHISTAVSTAVSLLIAIAGYLCFRDVTRGNILNNFPQDNLPINIARFLFALNMMCTFPMETLVAREVVEELLFRGRPFSLRRHVAITTGLCAVSLAVGETVCNLGVLLELTGGLSASFLAFILPPACYIRLCTGPRVSWKTAPHWLCVCFGFTVMVLSTVLSIRHAATSREAAGSCWDARSHGKKGLMPSIALSETGRSVAISNPAAKSTEYLFDGLFGPQTTQEEVYDKAVSPILNQVMQGYNCTIFAYGQTGTGKTYTMEGDLGLAVGASAVSTPMVSRIPSVPGGTDLLSSARMSTQAGMIPRTLHNMFYLLDKQSVEYYVRVSYVEIYREELRDLLSDAGSRDDGSGRMGHDTGSNSNLKVLDSGTDKGVVIQGLNDRIVKSAREAIGLLQAGATRRKVAATQCNDKSSRSHAIFTITVFIRERAVTVEGEDVVKLGKLNLVDLAGSESIGRSGAQNDNAHEAGKINQSLLVLGRVISALGAKAAAKDARVPYRDSKLTHILKDSLGGRTRTCMIATISNSTDNIEVTTSTLQYASQARGIRNRPVANRKVSKSDILHDMQHQMEQLQRDLDAARDGEGFFITRESYGELAAQAEGAKEVAEEWKQRVALWEQETTRVTALHDELTRTHAATEAQLCEREQMLATARAEADQARADLAQQTVLTRAHMLHEDALNATAHTLHGSLGAAAADAHGLQAKLARMADGERRTLAAVDAIGALVGREAARVAAAVRAHGARADAHAQQLVDDMHQRAGAPLDANVRSQLQQLVDQAQAQMADVAAAAQQTQGAAQAEHSQCLGAVVDLVANLHRTVSDLAAQGADECAEFVGHVRRAAAEQEAALADAALGVQRLVDAGVRDAAAALERAQAQARDAVAALAADADALRATHDRQLHELRTAIAELHADAQSKDADLVAAVADMLAQRRSRTESAVDGLATAAAEHAAAREAQAVSAVNHVRTVAVQAGESAAAAGAALQAAQTAVGERLEAVQTAQAAAAVAQTELAARHAAGVERRLQAMGPEAIGLAQQQAAAATQQAQQAADRASNGAAQALDRAQQLAAATLAGAQQVAGAAVGAWGEARARQADAAATHAVERAEAAAELDTAFAQLADTVRGAAANVGPVVRGGQTPTKRTYASIDQWNVTRSHDYILAQLARDDDAGNAALELSWTGEPVSAAADDDADMAEPASGRSTSSSTSTLAPLETSPARKRPSDTAVSPASDDAAQRPTRRARSDDAAAEPASAIIAPPSRLPAPRKSRRTRT
ncbi:hypothetical protein H4R19_001460 [Coemansia spiralis]|nr:hypothetical protein H4R19_001460 [Coemansia spiralis]